jgi:hypothetical protein
MAEVERLMKTKSLTERQEDWASCITHAENLQADFTQKSNKIKFWSPSL